MAAPESKSDASPDPKTESPGYPHGPDCSPETAKTTPYLMTFGIVYVGALILLRFVSMPRGAQIALALVPVPFFALYLRLWPLVFWFYFLGLIAARRRYQ